ncbi:GH39 family glycosyl hydrolase [Paenibacillus typhae]|uniref:Beta-xylosidase n=1 Tax=Paenibacillus typhae TaxID=1174501 RepID=A0A1G8R9Q3_9BACL|nr:helix-turn-helix domain-containing protein [Paenibacillus typhae]SDJ13696.1 Beta-xylosidase [Paenibacillus typhae]
MSTGSASPLLTYELSDQKNVCNHRHADIELLYILKGSLRVKVDGEEFKLSVDQMMIVNSQHQHAFHSNQDVFYVTIHLNYQRILSLLNAGKVFYLCNSSIEDKQEYATLQQLVKDILRTAGDPGSSGLEEQMGQLKLIDCLSRHFSVTYSKKDEGSRQSNNRRNEMEDYIQANYSRNISLKDLADFLYLSPPYVSKHFKEQFGVNFYKYLNHIRLNHAMDDLLGSGLSVTSIAMNNGFPNVSSFNKWFREKYSTTPHEYRQKHVLSNSRQALHAASGLKEYLKGILEKTVADPDAEQPDVSVLSAALTGKVPFFKYWTKVINLNEAATLRNFNLQEQIRALKNDLGFEYGRISNVFSGELRILGSSAHRSINFFNLERIFDSFMEMKIKPYLVFDPVTDLPNLGIDSSLDDEGKTAAFITLFQSLLSHLINRYGLKQVQDWYFELIYTPDNESISAAFYYRLFNAIKKSLQAYSADFRAGGAGLPIHYSAEHITCFLKQWFQQPYPPDFLTLYSEIQSYEEVEGEQAVRKLLDAEYIQNRVKMVRKILQDIGCGLKDVQISNWDCSMSRLNVINDSCYKAAHLMKNIIDCYGLLHGMGYWYALDSLSRSADMPSLLYGSPGLLSRQGLKKPSYYAYAFLNIGQSSYYLAKDSHSLITSNGIDNFFIVCHNIGSLNHQYYFGQESAADGTVAYTGIFEEEAPRALRYRITDVKNGFYKIKIRAVNETYGNIRQEWIRLNGGNELSNSEIEYLRQISIPRMKIYEIEVIDGTLELETVLSRNEIQSIRITYQY